MTLRVCNVNGCPNLQPESRCTRHRRDHEQARGTRQARGYDKAHDTLRRDYQRRMDTNGERFRCWRCHNPIDPQHWQLGHDDQDRTRYRGPECPPCNLATAGR